MEALRRALNSAEQHPDSTLDLNTSPVDDDGLGIPDFLDRTKKAAALNTLAKLEREGA
jgi:hypothetical protein